MLTSGALGDTQTQSGLHALLPVATGRRGHKSRMTMFADWESDDDENQRIALSVLGLR